MHVIELYDVSDPRFLLVDHLPDRVTFDDLLAWRYGKPLVIAPKRSRVIYRQPGGAGTDWLRPPEAKA